MPSKKFTYNNLVRVDSELGLMCWMGVFLERDDWGLVGWLKEMAKAYVQVLTEEMFYIF